MATRSSSKKERRKTQLMENEGNATTVLSNFRSEYEMSLEKRNNELEKKERFLNFVPIENNIKERRKEEKNGNANFENKNGDDDLSPLLSNTNYIQDDNAPVYVNKHEMNQNNAPEKKRSQKEIEKLKYKYQSNGSDYNNEMMHESMDPNNNSLNSVDSLKKKYRSSFQNTHNFFITNNAQNSVSSFDEMYNGDFLRKEAYIDDSEIMTNDFDNYGNSENRHKTNASVYLKKEIDSDWRGDDVNIPIFSCDKKKRNSRINENVEYCKEIIEEGHLDDEILKNEKIFKQTTGDISKEKALYNLTHNGSDILNSSHLRKYRTHDYNKTDYKNYRSDVSKGLSKLEEDEAKRSYLEDKKFLQDTYLNIEEQLEDMKRTKLVTNNDWSHRKLSKSLAEQEEKKKKPAINNSLSLKYYQSNNINNNNNNNGDDDDNYNNDNNNFNNDVTNYKNGDNNNNNNNNSNNNLESEISPYKNYIKRRYNTNVYKNIASRYNDVNDVKNYKKSLSDIRNRYLTNRNEDKDNKTLHSYNDILRKHSNNSFFYSFNDNRRRRVSGFKQGHNSKDFLKNNHNNYTHKNTPFSKKDSFLVDDTSYLSNNLKSTQFYNSAVSHESSDPSTLYDYENCLKRRSTYFSNEGNAYNNNESTASFTKEPFLQRNFTSRIPISRYRTSNNNSPLHLRKSATMYEPSQREGPLLMGGSTKHLSRSFGRNVSRGIAGTEELNELGHLTKDKNHTSYYNRDELSRFNSGDRLRSINHVNSMARSGSNMMRTPREKSNNENFYSSSNNMERIPSKQHHHLLYDGNEQQLQNIGTKYLFTNDDENLNRILNLNRKKKKRDPFNDLYDTNFEKEEEEEEGEEGELGLKRMCKTDIHVDNSVHDLKRAKTVNVPSSSTRRNYFKSGSNLRVHNDTTLTPLKSRALTRPMNINDLSTDVVEPSIKNSKEPEKTFSFQKVLEYIMFQCLKGLYFIIKHLIIFLFFLLVKCFYFVRNKSVKTVICSIVATFFSVFVAVVIFVFSYRMANREYFDKDI